MKWASRFLSESLWIVCYLLHTQKSCGKSGSSFYYFFNYSFFRQKCFLSSISQIPWLCIKSKNRLCKVWQCSLCYRKSSCLLIFPSELYVFTLRIQLVTKLLLYLPAFSKNMWERIDTESRPYSSSKSKIRQTGGFSSAKYCAVLKMPSEGTITLRIQNIGVSSSWSNSSLTFLCNGMHILNCTSGLQGVLFMKSQTTFL